MSLTQINKAGLDEIALDHVFTIGASGSSAYTFQGEGLNGTVNNPTLYLTRGKTYRFENGTGGHPIRIQSTSGASGTQYNTGVTNNAGSGTVIVEVQHDAPDVLYYQCTSHGSMGGILYITGALADGGVTTAKIADDAVNNDKLANSVVASIAANTAKTSNATHTGDVTGSTSLTIASGAVTEGKIASNAVITAKIADGSVTGPKIADATIGLDKLAHGTSSNDGKFLRANNGADPTFETITGTTINTNGDNRVITGTGTANTIQGEPQLTFDSSGILRINAPDGGGRYFFGETGNSQSAQLSLYNSSDQQKIRLAAGEANAAEANTFFNGGRVGIGTSSPDCKLHISGSEANLNSRIRITDTTNNHTLGIGCDGNGSFQSTVNDSRHIIYTNGTIRGSWTGNGLCFNNDTAAANALDDYEEGTWTPTLTNVFASGTSSGRVNVYRKIGSMVFFTLDIFASSSNMDINTNGDTVIGGLPFTPLSSFNSTMNIGIYLHNASGQVLNNYIDTAPQIVLHGSSRINNVRHLWGFGCYAVQ